MSKKKSKITKLIKDEKRIPPVGCNPAAKTGNAAGFHAPKKGRGTKYKRNKENQDDTHTED